MLIAEASVAMTASLGEVPVSITFDFGDGDAVRTGGDDAVTVELSRFEMFRSRLGRRTREQVRGLSWTGSDAAVDAVLDHWFIFGPSEHSIDE